MTRSKSTSSPNLMSSSTTIPNPAPDVPYPERQLVQSYIPKTLHDAFTRAIICGTKGAMSALIHNFLHKLHEEWLAAGYSATTYDFDNDKRLTEFIARLNFRTTDVPPAPRKRKPVRTTP